MTFSDRSIISIAMTALLTAVPAGCLAADLTQPFTISFRSDNDARANMRLYTGSSFVSSVSTFIAEESLPYVRPSASVSGYDVKARHYSDIYYRKSTTTPVYGYLDFNSGDYKTDVYGCRLKVELSGTVTVSRVVVEACSDVAGVRMLVSNSMDAETASGFYTEMEIARSGDYAYYEFEVPDVDMATFYLKLSRYTDDEVTLAHCLVRSITVVPSGCEWSKPEPPDTPPSEIALTVGDEETYAREFIASGGACFSFPLPGASDGRALDAGSFKLSVESPEGTGAPAVEILPSGSFLFSPVEEGVYGVTADYDDGSVKGSASFDVSIYPSMPDLYINEVFLSGDYLSFSGDSWESALVRGLPERCELWWRTDVSGKFVRYDAGSGIRLLGGSRLDIYLSKNGASSPVRSYGYSLNGLSSVVEAWEATDSHNETQWFTIQGLPVGDASSLAPGVYIVVRDGVPRKVAVR